MLNFLPKDIADKIVKASDLGKRSLILSDEQYEDMRERSMKHFSDQDRTTSPGFDLKDEVGWRMNFCFRGATMISESWVPQGLEIL